MIKAMMTADTITNSTKTINCCWRDFPMTSLLSNVSCCSSVSDFEMLPARQRRCDLG